MALHTVLSQWQSFIKQIGTEFKEDSAGVAIDGKSLDLSIVVAVARHGTPVHLTDEALRIMQHSISVIQRALEQGKVVYGVNTGFGGSADTRILEMDNIQSTIVQELQCGILNMPAVLNDLYSPGPLPLSHESTCMPESWVRAAMLLRVNSLACGFSGVRPVLVRSILHLLKKDIIPQVPLRGSISASGDLMPLSYIAGAIQGSPNVRVWTGVRGQRVTVTADVALRDASLPPVVLHPKEGLAIVNGTAVSTGVAAMAMQDANCLAVLSQVLTSMTVEALLGSRESFDPLFAQVRPHLGQIEAARNIYSFLAGSRLVKSADIELNEGLLYQDRYSIRTASQWIGPVLEDFQLAYQQILTECNSVTDNPLVDTRELIGRVLNGGNFQARAITSAMEKTRQGIQTIGQMLFTQCTELMNPRLSQGLPPNLAADNPSSSWLLKPLDILTAALQSELGFLSSSAGSHVQPAEMGNQALNSLALISARYTHTALEVLSQLAAAHLLSLCQALDLRALHQSFLQAFEPLLKNAIIELFNIPNQNNKEREDNQDLFWNAIWVKTKKLLNETVSMESKIRFQVIFKALQPLLLDAYSTGSAAFSSQDFVLKLQDWTQVNAGKAMECYVISRETYFENPDASPLLGVAASHMYKFVRQTLGVPFLRREIMFVSEKTGRKRVTVGECVSIIYASIRDGRLFTPVMECLSRVHMES
ncbi:phenylalanine ammonia-lyase protein [Rutstroemia sp. NJR-2017a BVV2]|nr:phenylalanine ammonia-lyase protein [Rutstroemia sp. NJR-2017a BVV2]